MPQIQVKNLASLKRAIAMPGISIRVLSHWQPNLSGTTRTPVRVQGNGYYFMGMDCKGQTVRMWAELPKSGLLRFNDDGTVTFHPGEEKRWTLAFEIPETAS